MEKTSGRLETRSPSLRRPLLLRVLSVIVQIVHRVSGFLFFLGSLIDFTFNFFSHNTFSNIFLRGKMVIPEKSSPQYVTLIGQLDKRISLDQTIRREEGHRYYAALCIMAAKLVYENSPRIQYVVQYHWKMKFLGFEDYWNEYLQKDDTEAFMMSDEASDGEETVVVAFRGTEVFDSNDWLSDFDINWWELPGVGNIHGGFLKALGLQLNNGWPKDPLPNPNRKSKVAYYDIRDKLKSLTSQNDRTRFVVTGHSLGGALAILFVFVLILHDEVALLERLQGVYTYGQPRVGDPTFAEFMETKLKDYHIPYYRIVYNYDVVPRLPFNDNDFMFKHFGTGIYYDRHYKPKVVKEDPIKDYFSFTNTVKSIYSSIMEFIRSFRIGNEKGAEYKEGWFLRLTRIMLLFFIIGASNHIPQDYVNATRLGSPHVFDVYNDVLIE